MTAVSHLYDDLERFWAGVVRLALTTDWKGEGSDSKRNPLLYLLASVGRGKTMFLREAAKYVCIAAERHRVWQGATIMGFSFNGSFPLLPEELECVNFVGGDYLLLYVRILFCEMAFFGAAPADAFEHSVMQFYDELHAGRFSVGDVRREVRAFICSRSRRGGPRSKVVLFVDEINSVLTSQVGASVCASYGMDLRYPLRSESCSLTDLVGCVTIMTSLEAGLMLAEQTTSGRAAPVVQEIEHPPFRLLVSLMFLALSQRPWDPRDVENVTMSVGSKRASMKLMECAEIYALAAGSTWRTAFFRLHHVVASQGAGLPGHHAGCGHQELLRSSSACLRERASKEPVVDYANLPRRGFVVHHPFSGGVGRRPCLAKGISFLGKCSRYASSWHHARYVA